MPRVTIPGVGVVTFPYDMSPDEINAQAQRLYAEAQGKEAPLTRERRAPGAPSGLDAGHHPDSLARERFGKRVPGLSEIGPGDLPSDAAFLKRAPEVGGAAGMVIGGPLGAGIGAAGGSLLKGQLDRGAHLPTGGDLGGAAVEGGKSMALSAIPGLSRVAAQYGGPALARNARGVSRGLSALGGVGAGIASGNPVTGIGASMATRMLTSPGAVRSAGNMAARAGDVPMHAVNKAGFGALSADAYRKALLDALGADQPPASTVP
jgi:hypothetical protein